MSFTRLDYGVCDNPDKRIFNGICIYIAQYHHCKCLLDGKMCLVLRQHLKKEYATDKGRSKSP